MPAASPLQSIVVFSRSAPQICGPAVYVGRLPSLSAKAAPLWPKRLSCQSGHPIVGPRRRGGYLKSAYLSQATEQDDATIKLTVAGGTEGSNPLPSREESSANLTSSIIACSQTSGAASESQGCGRNSASSARRNARPVTAACRS